MAVGSEVINKFHHFTSELTVKKNHLGMGRWKNPIQRLNDQSFFSTTENCNLLLNISESLYFHKYVCWYMWTVE